MQGCGWPPEKVEVLLRDDPVILAEWREATTAPNHRPAESSDNITTLPPRRGTETTGAKHIHADASNRSIKPIHGTTRAYTLTRLKQQEPELFKRVTRGELSANAAAIEAGLTSSETAFLSKETNISPPSQSPSYAIRPSAKSPPAWIAATPAN